MHHLIPVMLKRHFETCRGFLLPIFRQNNLIDESTVPAMDPATAISLCKENIQPLRHGRNALQLGTALRAQEDSEAQQMLMQEKQ